MDGESKLGKAAKNQKAFTFFFFFGKNKINILCTSRTVNDLVTCINFRGKKILRRTSFLHQAYD